MEDWHNWGPDYVMAWSANFNSAWAESCLAGRVHDDGFQIQDKHYSGRAAFVAAVCHDFSLVNKRCGVATADCYR